MAGVAETGSNQRVLFAKKNEEVITDTSKYHSIGEFYDMFNLDGTTTTFSERDEMKHRAKKRPVAAAYSMSTMKELEPMNDECSAILTTKLDGLVGKDIDLGEWLHWYAFDLITTIAFSNRLVDRIEQALGRLDRMRYVRSFRFRMRVV